MWHFGQTAFLPAWLLGTLITLPQFSQLNSIIVDSVGILMTLPHWGHFPCLPMSLF